MSKSLYCALIAVFVGWVGAGAAFGQGTSFTYQGRLTSNGSPANGNYYMSFALFDTAQGGNEIAGPIIVGPVYVTNGLFSVILGFSESAAFNGSPRWLEVRVIGENEPAPATLLSPRQPLLPTPYAITAANLSGVFPQSHLPPDAARLSANQTFTGTK